MVSAADVANGKVPHWEGFLLKSTRAVIDYKVVIPSFDRPTELCGHTLSLLRQDGVPMDRVSVFVAPTAARPGGHPEWYRYTEECKSHGFGEVHIRPGGRTLDEQMFAAMEWVGSGYMIVMSDTVRRIITKETTTKGTAKAVAAPQGCVASLIEHGYHLLKATGCSAWSLNPSHRPQQLSVATITRKLGLLDGNLTGMLLPSDWRKMVVAKGRGLVYDVEWSASLWSHGHRFCRYQGLCCEHVYRQPGGQATLISDVTRRRAKETEAIKECAKKYPTLLEWVRKPKASLKNMEYRFKPIGPSGLTMVKNTRGRKRKYSSSSASTSAQRMARLRSNARRQKARHAFS